MPTETTLTRIVDGLEVPVAGRWVFDPAHTRVDFVARHLMVTKVRGGFGVVSGWVDVAENPTDSEVVVTIETASIDTGTEDRDQHLRSADFLDVENHPEAAFRSTSVEPYEDHWRLTGDLTIRAITRPVTLEFEFLGVHTDPWGNPKAAFRAWTELNRDDWDVAWNVPLEGGGVLVGKTVEIEIDVQATPHSD
jgi:polyisoprenoid-binding protein YceI